MSEKKELNKEETEKITGGTDGRPASNGFFGRMNNAELNIENCENIENCDAGIGGGSHSGGFVGKVDDGDLTIK